MRRLTAFNSVSLDGYFADANGDVSWAHQSPDDAEWNAFVAGNASGGGALVFGRITYEMMASFWPTPAAAQAMPEVAKGMNAMPKYVITRTLTAVSWENANLLRGNLVSKIRKLKEEPGPDLTILGSGSIVSQLAVAGLIDELQVVVIPVVLGKGRPLFSGVKKAISFKLLQSRTFGNGNVLLSYGPVE